MTPRRPWKTSSPHSKRNISEGVGFGLRPPFVYAIKFNRVAVVRPDRRGAAVRPHRRVAAVRLDRRVAAVPVLIAFWNDRR
ncbi:MAG: hypothetical protein ACOX5I_07225 [Gleimia sp.]